MVGRYEENETDGGSFYVGDDTETCSEQDLFVNAWMPLPESYNTESENPQTNADKIRSMTVEYLARFLINFENTFGEEYEGEMSCADWLKSESEE